MENEIAKFTKILLIFKVSQIPMKIFKQRVLTHIKTKPA